MWSQCNLTEVWVPSSVFDESIHCQPEIFFVYSMNNCKNVSASNREREIRILQPRPEEHYSYLKKIK